MSTSRWIQRHEWDANFFLVRQGRSRERTSVGNADEVNIDLMEVSKRLPRLKEPNGPYLKTYASARLAAQFSGDAQGAFWQGEV